MDGKLCGVKVLMDTSISPNRDYETVLEAVARKIPSEQIYCINFDSEYAIYELYLPRILDIITLLRDGIEICGVKIPVCPSYDAFLVSGVYPFIENSTLCELFSKFGNVSRISDIRVSPDTATFSHIKSGFRQVELSIPGREENVCLPSIITAVIEGFSVLFTIRKLCYICMNLGHDTVKCPCLCTSNLDKIKYSLLANNEIVSFDDFNFVFKEDINEERMTVRNEEKSDIGIIKSDEGYKYLSVQSPGRLTASSSSAVHSNSDMLLTDVKHCGNENFDIKDELTNLNICQGKKRKHSGSSTSTNDQNLSEVSNVACLNIRNEVINSNVSLNPKNCLSPSVSDDSGGQFKKLYSVSYCARCKEELEFDGNNSLPQPSEEIANNKVSKNVLSQIHVKNSGLETQLAENLSTVPLSFNENFEPQNRSSNVSVGVISRLDDGTYVGKEENFPKPDIHCVREDQKILPKNINELKSLNVHSIKKAHKSFLKNTDELRSTNKPNVEQSKEEILSIQLSRRDPLPWKNIYKLSRCDNVTTVPLSINESYEPQNQNSNPSSDVISRSDGVIYVGKQENFNSISSELKIEVVHSVGEDHISLPENTNELKNSDVLSIKTVHESFLENNDELESGNKFNIGQRKEEILSIQSSRRDPLPWKNIYKLSRCDNVTTVPLSINESYEPQNQSSNPNSDVISRSDGVIYVGKQENFNNISSELKIEDVHSLGEDHISLPKNTNELKNSDVLSIKTVHESFLENNDELESTKKLNIGQSKEEKLSFQSSLSIQSSSDVTDANASRCTNEVVDYSAVKNLTNNVSFSKHQSVDLADKTHQIQLSDSKRWDPLPWKNIDELSRNDADESSTCSSTSLPSVEELLKLF